MPKPFTQMTRSRLQSVTDFIASDRLQDVAAVLCAGLIIAGLVALMGVV